MANIPVTVAFVLLSLLNINKADDLVRTTTSGDVKGEMRYTTIDEQYYAFHGIPYAAPPVGPLRFEPPQSPQSWSGVYDVSDDSKYRCCFQPEDEYHDLHMSEDCLLLSVYTPLTSSEEETSLPVVVWIHGGSLLTGCGMYPFYGPEKIMKGNDVVMVSINYRMGNLGFLSLGNNQLIGNMGLKDQSKALQWVRDNIHEFGGNPEKVTIMGESAGSWSVFYHMMSPYSKGLFQQVIGESGSVLSPGWHEYTKEEASGVHGGEFVVNAFGCNATEDIDSQVLCLKQIDAGTISASNSQVGFMGSQAVVDDFSDQPFLPDHPRRLMQSGSYNKDVNVLLGTNRDEGLLTTYTLIEDETQFEVWQEQWDFLGPLLLFGLDPYVEQTPKTRFLVDKVTNFYLGDISNMNIQHIHDVTQMFTDATFAYGVHDFNTLHLPNSNPNSIFQYQYVHEGESSLTKEFGQRNLAPYGVCHADDLYMLFEPLYIDYLPKDGLNAADTAVSNTMLALWKAFIITGNPSTTDITWTPIRIIEDGYEDRRYLRLTYAESSYMEFSQEWANRMDMWDEVMQYMHD